MITKQRLERQGKTYKGHVSTKWAPNVIMAMLKNDFYAGVLTLGKTKKRSINGKKIKQPEEKHYVFEDAHEPIIDKQTFKLVQEKKTGNIKAGTIKGGQTGKRGPTWTEEQALEVAMKIINEGMTYCEAEACFKIPSSTLHEMVTKGVQDFDTASMLYVVAEANRRGMSAQEYIEEHRRLHPNSEDIAKEIMEAKIAKSGKK
jgi:hypothetical protein